MKDNSPENNFKYIEVKLLGKGSYGKAYLVECTSDKTLAVIKTIPIDKLDELGKKEAYLESKILEKLDHPNIIKFREVFLTKPPNITLHIVMDYAEGGDLQKRINCQREYFSENQILDWFTQICLAIKYIHDRKILHRDIKSQNIFLTRNNLIKLGDFGTAKCLNYTLEQVQTTKGTPYYLSPEIVMNKPYSFESDIWSLGVLLYEMTTLKMPFHAQTLPMLCFEITKGDYKPIPKHFSLELKLLIHNMLQLDPKKRLSIYGILGSNIIRSRIDGFLSEYEYNKEFSHRILHKFTLLSSPEKKLKNTIDDENSHRNMNGKEQRDRQNNYIIPELPNMDSGEKNKYVNNINSHIEKETNFHNNELVKTSLDVVPEEDKHIHNFNNVENHNTHKFNYENQGKDRHLSLKSAPNIHVKTNIQEGSSITQNTKSESLQSDKDGKHNDILNVLAKHKKNIKANKDLKTPRTNQNSNQDGGLQNPESKNLCLKGFIETMHNKINLSIDQNEGYKTESLKIECNKEEVADLLSMHKILIELSTIDTHNLNKEQEKHFHDISQDSETNNSFDLTNVFKSKHFIPDEIKFEDIKIEINMSSENNELEAENSELELIRNKLEDELGPEILMRLYKIVSINTPENELKVDIDSIAVLVKNEFGNNFNESDVNAAINSIYQVWLLIVKERQETFEKQGN